MKIHLFVTEEQVGSVCIANKVQLEIVSLISEHLQLTLKFQCERATKT